MMAEESSATTESVYRRTPVDGMNKIAQYLLEQKEDMISISEQSLGTICLDKIGLMFTLFLEKLLESL